MHHLRLSIGLIPLFLLAACAVSPEDRMRAELEAANHCESAEDCVLIGSVCPFDCYIYVHASEADRLRPELEAYPSTCMYSCIQSFGVACENKKCVAKTEPPPEATAE